VITLFRVVTYLKFNYMEKNQKSRGLGDSIEKFTKATGIKSLVQFGTRITGKKDCGCNKRKKALNKAFPYKK
jgi:hypothetical protein